jgi:hypothetical protein
MKSQDWLPILTFILGSIFSLASESLRNHYQRDRDREARLSEQAVLREREQQEFMAKTLIELQDSLFDLMSYNQRIMYPQYQSSTDPGTGTQADIRSRILVVRVRDDQLRESVELVLARLMALSNSRPGEAEAWDKWREAAAQFEAANDRIGQLLQTF